MSKNEESNLTAMVAKLAKTVGEMNKNVAQREDINDLKEHFSQRIDKNSRDINKLFNMRKEDQETLDDKIQRAVTASGSCSSGNMTNTAERSDYVKCRKSVRIWPVVQTTEGLEADCTRFLQSVLLIPHEIIQRLDFVKVSRLGQSRRSKIRDEVLIELATLQQRDIIQSYAVNLAKKSGTAGIRMEIPQHLEGDFRLLEEHAGLLNKRRPGTKRSVKFDDIAQGLCIDIKLPDSEQWHRFTTSQIRELGVREGGGMEGSVGGESAEERTMILNPNYGGENSARTASGRE